MKNILLFIVCTTLLASLHAQRRYSHFPRVKIDTQQVPNTLIVDSGSVDQSFNNNMQGVEVIENKPIFIQSVVPSKDLPEEVLYKKKPVNKTVSERDDRMNSPAFWDNVLETHKKLKQVKNIKKPMLRTWLLLFIIACVILLLGLIFIILAYNPPFSGVIMALGYSFTGVGFIAAVIILILGLSGRI